MMNFRIGLTTIATAILLFGLQGCSQAAREIERPEKIVSKRITVYDGETYSKLAELWERYYDAFPSEDAYANWMYAARYAGDPGYSKMIAKGYKKYPANPTILYLYSMDKYGCHDDREGQAIMEKASRLDPTNMDVWFGLLSYYLDQDEAKMDMALRNLLEGGGIADEVMDFNYNMITSLDENAILITNGDMDTFPGWILKRILKYRPDVIIANRSLLNTDWYPFMLMKEGLPKFITRDGLKELQRSVMEEIKAKGGGIPVGGPYGDTLIVRLIEKATEEGRPVYFASTMYSSEVVERYLKQGRCRGIVTRVNLLDKSPSHQMNRLIGKWLGEFRTAGLDSWHIRHATEAETARSLSTNYAHGLYAMMEDIVKYAPDRRLELFHWYKNHMMELIPERYVDEIGKMWCSSDDIKEIEDWCRKQGYTE